ncbi:MAG: hypothetical protein IJ774_06005, partial [Selenomonadaceae bacterium]|nr:hypothetical protein [Selenomonadaceae bacterium]
MPLIDAGATGIRPIDRQRPTDEVSGIRRRDDGSTSGGFRPQTNVALKTAIQDLAGTLSKIGAQEKFGIQKMPTEVGDVVKNILQQSFSMNATLAKGIGSTVESQRFSTDQLMLFSRMLLQIGALADKGYSMELSDETQMLLSNLKALVVSQEGGDAFEPVLMSKAAFELVDAKVAEQLPPALYEMLAQLAQMSMPAQQQDQPPSEGMQFLKQLVRYFMPRPEVDARPKQQGQPQAQEQPQGQPQPQGRPQQQSATRRFLESMFKNFGGRFNSPTAQNQPQSQPTQAQNQPQGQPSTQSQPQGQPSTQNQPQGQPSTQSQPQGQPSTQYQPQGQPSTQNQPQGQPSTQYQQPQGQPSTQSQPQGQP